MWNCFNDVPHAQIAVTFNILDLRVGGVTVGADL
jgi:hypothetical protein